MMEGEEMIMMMKVEKVAKEVEEREVGTEKEGVGEEEKRVGGRGEGGVEEVTIMVKEKKEKKR